MASRDVGREPRQEHGCAPPCRVDRKRKDGTSADAVCPLCAPTCPSLCPPCSCACVSAPAMRGPVLPHVLGGWVPASAGGGRKWLGPWGCCGAALSARRPVCPGPCGARSCGRAGHVLCGGPALHQCRGDASEHLCSGDPGAGPFSGGILGTAAVGHHLWPPPSVMKTTDVPRNGPVPWEAPGYSTGLSCAETHAEALPGFHPKPVLLEVSQPPWLPVPQGLRPATWPT